ncbi:MAG: DUF123 domain-containing protein [Sulfolobales archaeon]
MSDSVEASYLLIIKVFGKLRVKIARKIWVLDGGYYAYLGSACLAKPYVRVLRHFTTAKRVHWHIDKITSHKNTQPIAGIVLYGVSEESLYNAVFSSKMFVAAIPKFGSTDREKHFTHLFKFSYFKIPDTFSEILSLAEDLGAYLIELLLAQ